MVEGARGRSMRFKTKEVEGKKLPSFPLYSHRGETKSVGLAA